MQIVDIFNYLADSLDLNKLKDDIDKKYIPLIDAVNLELDKLNFNIK